MTIPPDQQVPVGKVHVTLCDMEMIVKDYDKLGHPTILLRAGSVFQPWDPRHWAGSEVPITLGDQASQFDWGVTDEVTGIFGWDGHFLNWDDFFTKCQLVE